MGSIIKILGRFLLNLVKAKIKKPKETKKSTIWDYFITWVIVLVVAVFLYRTVIGQLAFRHPYVQDEIEELQAEADLSKSRAFKLDTARLVYVRDSTLWTGQIVELQQTMGIMTSEIRILKETIKQLEHENELYRNNLRCVDFKGFGRNKKAYYVDCPK